MTPDILEAIDLLASAIIAAKPDLKSSDKAFAMCLHEFRIRYLAQRAAKDSAPAEEAAE